MGMLAQGGNKGEREKVRKGREQLVEGEEREKPTGRGGGPQKQLRKAKRNSLERRKEKATG